MSTPIDHAETLAEFFKTRNYTGKHVADWEYAKFRAEYIAYVQNGRRPTGGFGKHRPRPNHAARDARKTQLIRSTRYNSSYTVVERAA